MPFIRQKIAKYQLDLLNFHKNLQKKELIFKMLIKMYSLVQKSYFSISRPRHSQKIKIYKVNSYHKIKRPLKLKIAEIFLNRI